MACHSRSASLHHRCWSGRAEGSLYPWERSELKTLTCDITSCRRSTAVGGRWKFLGSWRHSFFLPLCYLERLWRFWSWRKRVTMLCHYLPPPQPHLTLSPSVYPPHDASASRGSEAITQAHFNFLISASVDGPTAAGQKAKSIILHYRAVGVKRHRPHDCRKPPPFT